MKCLFAALTLVTMSLPAWGSSVSSHMQASFTRDSAMVEAVSARNTMGSVKLCRQGGPASEAEYLYEFNLCRSVCTQPHLCNGLNGTVDGKFYTNGLYVINCVCY